MKERIGSKKMNHILKKFDIDTTEIVALDPKEFGIRKKIDIFFHEKSKTFYLHTAQKARVLQKDVEVFENIFLKVVNEKKIEVDKKFMVIDSPLCSKAKTKFEEQNWEVLV